MLFTKTSAMPQLEVLPPSKVAKLLTQREASHVFFADLASMARGVEAMLTHKSEDIRKAGHLLMKPTSLKLGSTLSGDDLAKACTEACVLIESVVSDDVLNGLSVIRQKDENGDDDTDEDVDDSAFEMEGTDQPLKLSNVPNRFTLITSAGAVECARNTFMPHWTASRPRGERSKRQSTTISCQ